MNTGTAIFLGLALIAAAIFYTGLNEQRYQLLLDTKSAGWRLDTKTGKVDACWSKGVGVICGDELEKLAR